MVFLRYAISVPLEIPLKNSEIYGNFKLSKIFSFYEMVQKFYQKGCRKKLFTILKTIFFQNRCNIFIRICFYGIMKLWMMRKIVLTLRFSSGSAVHRDWTNRGWNRRPGWKFQFITEMWFLLKWTAWYSRYP